MATISEADVWRAADELIAAEENPTIERIRARLGGGSQTTIVKHLKAWRAERDGPQRLDLPDVPTDVAEAFRACWMQAAQEARVWAEGQYQEMRDAVARERDAARHAVDEARAAANNSQHKLDVLNERLAHVDQARATAEQREVDLEEALAEASREREQEHAQQRDREQAMAQERSELMQSVASARKALADALRRCRADERTHQRALGVEKQRYEDDTGHWLRELDKARRQSQEAEQTAENLQGRLQQAKAETTSLQEARERAEAENRRLREALAQSERTERESRRQLEAEREQQRSALADNLGTIFDTQQSIKELIEALSNEQRADADNKRGESDSKT